MHTTEAPSRSRSLAWFLGLVVVGGTFAWIVSSRQNPPSQPIPPTPPLAEIDAAQLIRWDGRLVLRDNTNQTFNGWMTEHYQNGPLKSRSQISNGVLSGISEGFHTNGILQIREQFVDGIGDGLVEKWHPDGARLSSGTARHGQLEGTFRRWHTNGVLAEEISLKDGQPHGNSRAWFASGSLKAEVELENGKIVRQTFWKDGENKPPAP